MPNVSTDVGEHGEGGSKREGQGRGNKGRAKGKITSRQGAKGTKGQRAQSKEKRVQGKGGRVPR